MEALGCSALQLVFAGRSLLGLSGGLALTNLLGFHSPCLFFSSISKCMIPQSQITLVLSVFHFRYKSRVSETSDSARRVGTAWVIEARLGLSVWTCAWRRASQLAGQSPGHNTRWNPSSGGKGDLGRWFKRLPSKAEPPVSQPGFKGWFSFCPHCLALKHGFSFSLKSIHFYFQ